MITIGVVTYDRPEFLLECVNSILAQSYQDWYLIISNDYVLKDVTFDTLGISPDPRITIINQEKNIGELANLNFLLGLATTKYFTWLCDDDQFNARFLECALDALNFLGTDNLVAFYSNYRAGLTYDIYEPVKEDGFLVTMLSFEPKQFIERYLLKQLPLIGCYGVMQTKALKNIGGFTVLGNSFSPYADTLLPILLSQYGQVVYSNVPLVFLRTHQSSMSFTSSDFQGYVTAEEDFVNELISISKRCPNAIDLQRCLGLACLWFSDNNFTVLMRGRTNSTLDIYLKYFKHQFTISLPRLNLYWKLRLLFHIIHFCLDNFIESFGRKAISLFGKYVKNTAFSKR
jgi:glycosyltransferase involved in cell wall biosynthesis